MEIEEDQGKWVKKIRGLTTALILSGGLNIGLLATFFYFVLKDTEELVSEGKKAPEVVVEKGNSEYLRQFSRLSFRELLPNLARAEYVEEGYSRRDLTIAVLVKYHHFNLEKALPSQNLQKRRFIFLKGDKEEEITLFPALSEEQYKAIENFAYSEKWPLTSEGLFYILKQMKKPRDNSLEWAFSLTQEFHTIRSLFGERIKAEEILDLLTEIDWKDLSRFTLEQVKIQDWSQERLRTFLLLCFEKNSKNAGKYLLKFDLQFVVKKFSDKDILKLLGCLQEESMEGKSFCLELLKSQRGDNILQASAKQLYCFAKENPPEPYDHKIALKRFLGNFVYCKKEIGTERKHYVVQFGDNLWKIAKMQNVSINEILKANNLKKEVIQPGDKLIIP